MHIISLSIFFKIANSINFNTNYRWYIIHTFFFLQLDAFAIRSKYKTMSVIALILQNTQLGERRSLQPQDPRQKKRLSLLIL